MKYCRFVWNQEPRYGLLETQGGEEIVIRAISTMPSSLDSFAGSEPVRVPLRDAKLLPSAAPSKIICVGRNYRDHVRELGHEMPTSPLIFLKPPSALIAPGEEIRRPAALSERVDYEGELAVIIGKQCRRIPDTYDVRPYIHGFTCLNDVTARDLQNKDGQWTRAKGFDTFCPIGPIVSDGLDPWSGVELETRVNGEVKQRGNTTEFLFPLDVLVRFASQVMTLYPGDVIATGTPAGVGPLQAGDVVEVSISGIGTLRNPVVND